jgi:hypothetical protein
MQNKTRSGSGRRIAVLVDPDVLIAAARSASRKSETHIRLPRRYSGPGWRVSGEIFANQGLAPHQMR